MLSSNDALVHHVRGLIELACADPFADTEPEPPELNILRDRLDESFLYLADGHGALMNELAAGLHQVAESARRKTLRRIAATGHLNKTMPRMG